MNNCKNMRVYSIGGIDRDPTGGKEWRLELDKWLPSLGIIHLNPHDKPFYGPQEDDNVRREIEELKRNRNFTQIKKKYGYIRRVDLRCVDYADFIIARIDKNIHLAGTYEELVTANREKKSILCHIVGGIENTPNWLIFMLPEWSFFDTMEDLKSYLYKINSTPYEKLDKRWVVWKNSV